jgi:hypothetical protein
MDTASQGMMRGVIPFVIARSVLCDEAISIFTL